mgnify:CR=1 FL=1
MKTLTLAALSAALLALAPRAAQGRVGVGAGQGGEKRFEIVGGAGHRCGLADESKT